MDLLDETHINNIFKDYYTAINEIVKPIDIQINNSSPFTEDSRFDKRIQK